MAHWASQQQRRTFDREMAMTKTTVILVIGLLFIGCRGTPDSAQQASVAASAPEERPCADDGDSEVTLAVKHGLGSYLADAAANAITEAVREVVKEMPEFFLCAPSQMFILQELQAPGSTSDDESYKPDKGTLAAVKSLRRALNGRQVFVVFVGNVFSRPAELFPKGPAAAVKPGTCRTASWSFDLRVPQNVRGELKKKHPGALVGEKLTAPLFFTWREAGKGESWECATSAYCLVAEKEKKPEGDLLVPAVITLKYHVKKRGSIEIVESGVTNLGVSR